MTASSMTAPRGKFISLEGGEGAGKSTLLAGLRERFAARGIDLLLTREPGGTDLGEAVRSILLDPARRGMSAESELLLMFASRAQLVREVIEPALAELPMTAIIWRWPRASHSAIRRCSSCVPMPRRCAAGAR